MKFRKHFDYDVDKASDESGVSFAGEVSMTVQSMTEDSDINVIMARFGVTGRMPDNPRVPMYGDFTGITDYQSALDAVSNAADAFMALPARIRSRFNNNPQELLEFVANDANIEEARSLGLLKEKVNVADGSRPSGASPGVGGPVATTGGAEPGNVAEQPNGPAGSKSVA